MESFRPHRGFTLIELLVVLAIMGIIMTIVISSQSSFNKTLVVANTTYDIALAIRSAENFGLGSRVASGVNNTGYGVEFTSASPTTFLTFADTYPSPSASGCHGIPRGDATAPDAQPGDCIYEPSQDQKINQYELGNGISVTQRCAFASGTWTCGLNSLDIVFARPNPTPFIRVNSDPNTAYSEACITVASQQGTARFITIMSSGEINTNAASNPNACHG